MPHGEEAKKARELIEGILAAREARRLEEQAARWLRADLIAREAEAAAADVRRVQIPGLAIPSREITRRQVQVTARAPLVGIPPQPPAVSREIEEGRAAMAQWAEEVFPGGVTGRSRLTVHGWQWEVTGPGGTKQGITGYRHEVGPAMEEAFTLVRHMGPIERMARQGGPTPQIPAGTMFDPATGRPLGESVRIGTSPAGVEWVSYRQGRSGDAWFDEIQEMRTTLQRAGGKVHAMTEEEFAAFEKHLGSGLIPRAPFIGPPAPTSAMSARAKVEQVADALRSEALILAPWEVDAVRGVLKPGETLVRSRAVPGAWVIVGPTAPAVWDVRDSRGRVIWTGEATSTEDALTRADRALAGTPGASAEPTWYARTRAQGPTAPAVVAPLAPPGKFGWSVTETGPKGPIMAQGIASSDPEMMKQMDAALRKVRRANPGRHFSAAGYPLIHTPGAAQPYMIQPLPEVAPRAAALPHTLPIKPGYKRVPLGAHAGRYSGEIVEVPARYNPREITEEDVIYDSAIKIVE